MRASYDLFIFFMSFIISSCMQDVSTNPKGTYLNFYNEDHTQGYDYPEYGSYYRYIYNYSERHNFNVRDTLIKIIEMDIPLQEAWHGSGRPKRRSCITTTIYYPNLFIRLNYPDRNIFKLKFNKMDGKPWPIINDNTVQHYIVTRYD